MRERYSSPPFDLFGFGPMANDWVNVPAITFVAGNCSFCRSRGLVADVDPVTV